MLPFQMMSWATAHRLVVMFQEAGVDEELISWDQHVRSVFDLDLADEAKAGQIVQIYVNT